MRITPLSVAFITSLVHMLIYAFIIYHCPTILAHFSASSQFPDVISSIPMGSVSPTRCLLLASPWSLPYFSCSALLLLSSLLDLGSGGSPGAEMMGMAFLLSLLVPRATVVSSSQEGNYSKESPEQSPEEAGPRSPKMERDQGRQTL